MLKVLQVGYGYWGPNLLKNIHKLPNVQLQYLVDQDTQRLKVAQQEYPDLKIAQNIEDVDPSNFDAVIIATPALTHFRLAQLFLSTEKHVFVEKPIATSAREVEELTNLAHEKNKRLMVGHVFLFNPVFNYIKDHIQEIGDLLHISSYRHNFGKVRSDVNCWWNLAPHDVSMVLSLADHKMPISVTAQGHSFLQPGIDDFCTATYEWENGLVAHISTNWFTPHKTRKMYFVGTEKMFVFDDTKQHKIEIHHKKITPNEKSIEHFNGKIVTPEIQYNEPLYEEIRHFFDCIQDPNLDCLTGPQHCYNVTHLLEAAQQSIQAKGETIGITSRELNYSLC